MMASMVKAIRRTIQQSSAIEQGFGLRAYAHWQIRALGLEHLVAGVSLGF